MTSALHNCIEAAMEIATDVLGGPVTYRRGTATGTFDAIFAPKDYEATGQDGVIVTYHCHDVLIVASKLVLTPAATEGQPAPLPYQAQPTRGDTITDASGQVHEVLLIPNRNCYDSGFDDIHYRIHTKRIG